MGNNSTQNNIRFSYALNFACKSAFCLKMNVKYDENFRIRCWNNLDRMGIST